MLAAMALPAGGCWTGAPKITAGVIDQALLSGSWKRLVLGRPSQGGSDRNAYVFCVLEQFHRHLKRREIYAEASTRWRDPRRSCWRARRGRRSRPDVLTDLQPAARIPDALLAEHARALDAALPGRRPRRPGRQHRGPASTSQGRCT